MVINTNVAAEQTTNNLFVSQENLTKSLSRLSSGSKIVQPSDDAAGLAVSNRLQAKIGRLGAAQSNVANTKSWTQTQDGFMEEMAKAFRRMSELSMLAQDATKSNDDRALYDQEFQQLKQYITDTKKQEFNGVSLFAGNTLEVTIDSEGTTFSSAGIDLGGYTYDNSINVDTKSWTLTQSAWRTSKAGFTVAENAWKTSQDLWRKSDWNVDTGKTAYKVSTAGSILNQDSWKLADSVTGLRLKEDLWFKNNGAFDTDGDGTGDGEWTTTNMDVAAAAPGAPASAAGYVKVSKGTILKDGNNATYDTATLKTEEANSIDTIAGGTFLSVDMATMTQFTGGSGTDWLKYEKGSFTVDTAASKFDGNTAYTQVNAETWVTGHDPTDASAASWTENVAATVANNRQVAAGGSLNTSQDISAFATANGVWTTENKDADSQYIKYVADTYVNENISVVDTAATAFANGAFVATKAAGTALASVKDANWTAVAKGAYVSSNIITSGEDTDAKKIDSGQIVATDQDLGASGANIATENSADYKNVNLKSKDSAAIALSLVKAAITQAATDRARLGATQSRLNFTNAQVMVSMENLSAAVSRITDVDVAEESTHYARYQILVATGTQMLRQANQLPQGAMELLR